jgi:AraC family transcriptional activator of pobA
MKLAPVFGIGDFNEQVFYVNTLSNHIKQHAFIEKPHKHNFYLVLMITQGHGTHEIDFTSFTVKPGSVFVIKPGQTHSWQLSKDIDGFIFFHTAELYNLAFAHKQIQHLPFYQNWQNIPHIHLSKSTTNSFVYVMNRLLQANKLNNSQYKFELIITLMDLFYLDLIPFYQSSSSSNKPQTGLYVQKTEELIALIDLYYKQIKSPAVYANMLNITPRHLVRIVQQTLAKTVGDLIADRVVLEARRMLIHPELTIKEVAFELGYDDVSYFIRYFKKQTQQTPAEFKKIYSQ